MHYAIFSLEQTAHLGRVVERLIRRISEQFQFQATAPARRRGAAKEKRHDLMFLDPFPGQLWKAVVISQEQNGRSIIASWKMTYLHRGRDGESGCDIALWVYISDPYGPGFQTPPDVSLPRSPWSLGLGGRGSPLEYYPLLRRKMPPAIMAILMGS